MPRENADSVLNTVSVNKTSAEFLIFDLHEKSLQKVAPLLLSDLAYVFVYRLIFSYLLLFAQTSKISRNEPAEVDLQLLQFTYFRLFFQVFF